jgi:hypothetical protein
VLHVMEITVGPVVVAQIAGDLYAALAARLGELGISWKALAEHMNMSRQNLQRALRLQAAVKVETITATLQAMHELAGERGRELDVAGELEAMGLRIKGTKRKDTATALLQAEALTRRGRHHG